MTKQEEKQRLRRTMRTLERQLPEKYKAASSRAICAHLLAMPEYQAASAVFCFVGTAREIDTRPILADALAAGKRLSVPRCTGPGVMELRQIRSFEELVPGAYGILEPPMTAPLTDPDDVDLAILPCLTCNHLGQRLGQGGGYYDRFLSNYRGGTVPGVRPSAPLPLRSAVCSRERAEAGAFSWEFILRLRQTQKRS